MINQSDACMHQCSDKSSVKADSAGEEVGGLVISFRFSNQWQIHPHAGMHVEDCARAQLGLYAQEGGVWSTPLPLGANATLRNRLV